MRGPGRQRTVHEAPESTGFVAFGARQPGAAVRAPPTETNGRARSWSAAMEAPGESAAFFIDSP